MRVAGRLLFFVCAAGLFTGCQKPAGEAAQSADIGQKGSASDSIADKSKPAADWSASDILKRLLATYRAAKTYRDNAVVRLAFRQNSQPVAQEQPFAVAYERPDKLSINAFQATVKCDGKQLKARI